MRLLVITPEYYPETYANALCLMNIVNALLEDGDVQCDILTIAHDYHLPSREVTGNTSITRIKSNYLSCVCNSKEAKNPFSKLLVRGINKVMSKIIWPSSRIVVKNRLSREAQRMISNNTYSAIITSSGDFVSQLVGLTLYKDFSLCWFPIILDPFPSIHPWYNCINRMIWRIKEKESALFMEATECFVEEHLKSTAFDKRKEYDCWNITKVGIPNLKDYDSIIATKHQVDGYITIIYAGVWKNNLRNPERCVEILKSLKLKKKIRLVVYSAEDYVSDDFITFKKYIPHDELVKEMIKSDFLLNIGNNIDIFPSKLIDYSSTGRPILNFVKEKSDITVSFISEYSNGFAVYENEFDNAMQNRLCEFLEKQHDRISYNELKCCFERYSPSYVADRIVNKINRVSEVSNESRVGSSE